MSRRLILIAVITVVAVLGPALSASAHVHGITPLIKLATACGVTPGIPQTGANRTDDTPAAVANGGPITGLIPRDVGQAPLGFGDGGFDAPVGCADAE